MHMLANLYDLWTDGPGIERPAQAVAKAQRNAAQVAKAQRMIERQRRRAGD